MAAGGEADKQVKAHERSYAAFIAMMKWGTIISAIVAVIVVLIIAD